MLVRKLLFLFLLFSLVSYAQNFETRWTTSFPGTSGTDQITIPTNPALTYDYTVDWGDGNTDSNVTGDITHTYASPGTYTVSISGVFPAIYFNNSGDRQKIIEILAWGTIQWESMENAFYGCVNMNFDAIDSPDLSGVTTLKNMFRGATSFNGILNSWDVSGITNISGMFMSASIFNRPLDNWNTIMVTDMSDTFNGANQYNEPLDNWNTASVTTMRQMFRSANQFNQNINSWDVSQVTDMSGMFYYAGQFDQPLNNWNVSNVTTMSGMFSGSDFNRTLSSWDVSGVTDMSNMFSQYCPFNQNINNWDVSSVTNMSMMFHRANAFNQPLDNWDVSSVTNMGGMFDGFFVDMAFNQPLNTWDVSQVTDMSNMFRDNPVFNQPLDNWDVSNVITMSRMFERADIFNQNVSGWDVSGVTDMSYMFQETKAFNLPLNTWEVSQVLDMSYMFYRSEAFNLPLDNWNTASVSEFQYMFGTSVFSQDISGWDVSAATNMEHMFFEAAVFDQNLATWNIANVFDMTNMLSDSGLSQANYDNTLIGWAALPVQDNVSLGTLNLNYCDGLAARQSLIDDHNWAITGDAVNCSYVLCTNILSPQDGDTDVPANSNIRWAPAPNATGYRVTLRRVNGPTDQLIMDDQDVGNVVRLVFTNEFTAGDTVYVTVVPYNADGPATGCATISFTVVESWVNSPDAFKLTYDTSVTSSTTTLANQLKIEANTGSPLNLTYDYSIDWGDGEYNNNVTGDITHTYLNPGVYTVSIIGTFPAPFHDYSNTDAIKLQTIDQWGTQVWQTMTRAFYGCVNMTYNATDVPDLSQVTDMSNMFSSCNSFDGNINNWDVSNVTNMASTFIGATSYNQPLDNWNVSNVTNMSLMFLAATSFDQNIQPWNVSSVTRMDRMFEQASTFNQPLNAWDVSSVTTMSAMFERAVTFNQPLNGWNVSAVTDMSSMFNGLISNMSFNQPLDNWDVSSVTNMSEMFERCVVFNQPLNTWNVGNVTDMNNMFNSARRFNQPLSNWNVGEVTNMSYMFNSAEDFNQNIDAWNVTNVLTMRSMFQSALSFNQPLNTWDVNSVVNMNSTFQNAQNFNQPLGNWDVSAVATTVSMFEDAVLFNQPLDAWDVSSVTLMASMFEDASAFNQPLNSWDVASVTTFEAMFKNAIAFDQPLGNWDTGEALTMAEMFHGATAFNRDIASWDVSFVTTMFSMFKDAVTYNQSMNSWNVASVTTMASMFEGASAFNGEVGNWNVRNVQTMENMFYGASEFNRSVNNWRVFNVGNMNSMFRDASSYNQPMEQWDLETVSMQSMFSGASVFDQFLGDWDVSQVSNMTNMLDNTALSLMNYDNTLIAWSEQNLTPGINLGANGLEYCDAVEERQSMIDNFGWTFSGDIIGCPIPECTQLVSPLNGAIDVPVNTNLTWDPVVYARGYTLTVRVMPGNVTLVNNEIVYETTYEFASDFSGSEIVYVTIVPFNEAGDAVGCPEESFTISSDATPPTPECTTLIDPISGATDVAVGTDLEWNAVVNADGYRLTVGTSTGATDILNNVDVGNVTNYDLPTVLPEDTQVFVTLVPYNTEGDATGCMEESFTTEIIPVPPACTSLTSPLDGTVNVPVDSDISWNAVPDATGYLVIVGITQGGNEIANNVDVGNATSYSFTEDLQPNRTHYVTIIPYNTIGDATGCLEESFRTGSATLNDPPACTSLSSPLNGAMNVAVDTDLTWNASANTDGYYLTVSTTSGGNDILNAMDVGNVTTYNLPADLPEATTIYVNVVPYNVNGSATGCAEESFTTETLLTPPGCTTLNSPINGVVDVSVSASLSWNGVTGADGYRLMVGTTSGGNDILDAIDVGNVTTYDPAVDFPESTLIFVTLIPYNSAGDATTCAEESFTTETSASVPACTSLTAPLNGATDVSVSASLTWNAVSGADGYRLTLGTTSGGNDLLDNVDVGATTTYDPLTDFAENTQVFVTLIPYNSVGDAVGCAEESFTTQTMASLPGCTSLSDPLNGATDVSVSATISWSAVSNADGYRLTLGTTSGGNDLLDDVDVGNVTTYTPVVDLPENADIFVVLVPYNSLGDATGCSEESFTTETLQTLPACTSLITPFDGATDVDPGTVLEWEAVANADGYYLTLGTTPGSTDLLDAEDVGILTSYQLQNTLPEGTQIYVSIVPYNSMGNATACEPASFTTSEDPLIESLYGFSPDGDGINDFWEIQGIENYPVNTVTIYNRWGDAVFKIEGYDNAGNVFRGQANQLTKMGADQLPEGTYFFQIQIAEPNNLKATQGFLVLKR